jgi:hypothetical protein
VLLADGSASKPCSYLHTAEGRYQVVKKNLEETGCMCPLSGRSGHAF